MLHEFVLDSVAMQWRWVDDKGHAMTEWKSSSPPPVLDLADAKGTMHVEVRVAPAPAADAKEES